MVLSTRNLEELKESLTRLIFLYSSFNSLFFTSTLLFVPCYYLTFTNI